MYYYIFEPSQGPKEYERSAQIKKQLSELGIAGEMTSPTPGKSVNDLVDLAIAKRYSTVIAVGSMDLINKVAHAVIPYEVVFGIIPTVDHPDIARLIGTSDWKQAADHLKRRRFHPVRMGLINDQICFLTPAIIDVPDDVAIELRCPDYMVSAAGGRMSITPTFDPEEEAETLLTVEIEEGTPRRSKGLLGGLFKKKAAAPGESLLRCPAFDLRSSAPLSVSVAGSVLATTPISCTTQVKPLKLIVGRGGSS